MNTSAGNDKPVHKMNRNELLSAYKQLEKEFHSQPDSESQDNALELTQALEKVKADKESWIEKALAKDDRIAELEEQTRAQEAENTRVRSALERRIKQFERNRNEEADLQPSQPNANKSTFRLEWYHPDGQPLQGRIEHLLSRQKQTFQGLNADAIMEFVKVHLPESSHEVAPEQEADANGLPAKPVQKELDSLEIQPEAVQLGPSTSRGSAASVHIGHFSLVHQDQSVAPNQLNHQQDICVQIELAGLENHQPSGQLKQILVYAKPLEGKDTLTLVDIEERLAFQPKLSLPIAKGSLAPGPYRVGVSIQADLKAGEKPVFMTENQLIFVF